MEAVAEQISFSTIAPQDIAEFHRQREKILSAVCDRLFHLPEFQILAEDQEKQRLARESAKILIENFSVTVKYQLPAALLEYLDWLRNFLLSRDFPPELLPRMLTAIRTASHAFLGEYNSDDLGVVLRQLRQREERTVEREKA